MKYKRYIGHVEYDDVAKIFHGEVVGLKDIITFQGSSVEELEEAFRNSVEDYLAWCKKRKEKPETHKYFSLLKIFGKIYHSRKISSRSL